jgi:hypothetical protein
MTTKLTLENDKTSNGDVHLTIACGFGTPERVTLFPGDRTEKWISTGHAVLIQETWPTTKPFAEKLVTINEEAHGHDA